MAIYVSPGVVLVRALDRIPRGVLAPAWRVVWVTTLFWLALCATAVYFRE